MEIIKKLTTVLLLNKCHKFVSQYMGEVVNRKIEDRRVVIIYDKYMSSSEAPFIKGEAEMIASKIQCF